MSLKENLNVLGKIQRSAKPFPIEKEVAEVHKMVMKVL